MARITLNQINDTVEEIPSKLLLAINAIGKGNAETHQLLICDSIKRRNSL